MIRNLATYWPIIPAVVFFPVIVAVLVVFFPLLVMFFFALSLAALGLFFYQYFLAPIKPRAPILRSVEAGNNRSNETAARVQTQFARRAPKTPFGDQVKTLSDLLQWVVEKYGSRPSLGFRKVIRTDEVVSKVIVDGKEVEKKLKIPTLSEYQWKSFTQVFDEVKKFSAGLVRSGSKLKELNDKVAIFANTRAEWQIVSQAAFYRGITVVTVYPSLGADALAFALDQTEVTHVITQVSLLDTILKASDKLPHLTTLIYFDTLTDEQLNSYRSKYSRFQFYSYAEILELGADKPAPAAGPSENDVAVIMFTSGSTGAPKGVLMSQKNILSTILAIAFGLQQPLSPEDVYIAYLPLAHILEMEAELGIISVGGRIGYASPITLRDEQAKDESGKGAGDLTVLKPTLMAAVPLVLDRIRAGVMDKIHKRGPVMEKVFNLALYLKERAWLRGEAAPLLDEYIFKPIRQNFGGRIRLILSGGAPLSKDTHKFVTLTVNAPVIQGYGLSETCAGGTLTQMDEQTFGIVGPPIACCMIKLVDIPDMNYLSTDKPYPRGEIWISGDNVALGYFKLPEKTAEDFREEKDGTRWFATGDVGQLLDDGNFQIIDRKKDLVKLVHGEYIALGKVEGALIQSKFIENVCVYGDGKHDRPIALVVPNLLTLGKALAGEGVPDSYLQDLRQLATHPKAAAAILKSFDECSNKAKLEKWERVAALKLCDFVWTPESGLLTEAFKLKRHEITKRFKTEIEITYASVKSS